MSMSKNMDVLRSAFLIVWNLSLLNCDNPSSKKDITRLDVKEKRLLTLSILSVNLKRAKNSEYSGGGIESGPSDSHTDTSSLPQHAMFYRITNTVTRLVDGWRWHVNSHAKYRKSNLLGFLCNKHLNWKISYPRRPHGLIDINLAILNKKNPIHLASC